MCYMLFNQNFEAAPEICYHTPVLVRYVIILQIVLQVKIVTKIRFNKFI